MDRALVGEVRCCLSGALSPACGASQTTHSGTGAMSHRTYPHTQANACTGSTRYRAMYHCEDSEFGTEFALFYSRFTAFCSVWYTVF